MAKRFLPLLSLETIWKVLKNPSDFQSIIVITFNSTKNWNEMATKPKRNKQKKSRLAEHRKRHNKNRQRQIAIKKAYFLNAQGVDLAESGEYETAIEKFEKALRINFNQAEILNNYGLALYKLRQYEAAIEKYEQALQIAPKDVHVLNNYGIVLEEIDQYEAAIEKYGQALQVTPKDVHVLNNYGITLAKSGQYRAAIEKFETALQINPDLIHTLSNYGRALIYLGQYEVAIEKYEKALALSSQPVFLYLTLGCLYYRIKSEKKGNKFFNLAIEHSEDKDATRLQAARDILSTKSNSKQGIAILKEVVKTSPRYAEAFKMLKLHLDPEAFFDMFNVPLEEELQDTDTLHRAIYHKMINEIFILKNILYRLERHHQSNNSSLRTAIEGIEEIQEGINTKREAARKQDREVPQDDYRARIAIISKTAQEISDFVNNGFFRLKSDIQRTQRHVSSDKPFYQQLLDLIARIEDSESALNDLKSLNEGITIRRNTFKIKQIFETWQAVPTFQHATIQLDIQNGDQKFYGDEQKIRSFVNELVENSVKHNPDNMDLRIDIAAYDEANPLIKNQTIPAERQYLVINVRDNGKGVPPDKKEWIFLPLKSTAKRGGGLGLFIIYRTLRKMDGHITETGTNGANFHIYIPYIKETP